MTKVDENLFPKIILQEAANDGSDFTNPAADYRVLFVGEDGLFHLKDSAGTVTTPTGGAYTPSGTDVAVADGGTGASTAAGAATNLGLGTGDSPQHTAVNIGHATDTTLDRASAGVLQVEGNRIFAVGGADVPIADGGTGASTKAAAFDALSPMTTAGDIIIGGAAGTGTRLAAGATSGHVLTSNGSGAAPSYQAAAGGGSGTVTTVKDEGSNLSTAVVSLDFVGAGVTATGTTAVTVTIPGGGSDLVQVASGAGSVRIPGLAVADRVPGSPHASDDEFDTTSTFTTAVGTLDTDNVTDVASHLHIKKTTTGTFQIHGKSKAIPSMPFTVTMKVTDVNFSAAYQRFGLMLCETGTAKIMEFGALFPPSAAPNFGYGIWTTRTSRASFTDGLYSAAWGFAPLWLRYIVTSSTNVTTQVSKNGLYFQTVASAVNPGFTIAAYGYFVTGEDNSVTVEGYADWIRIT